MILEVITRSIQWTRKAKEPESEWCNVRKTDQPFLTLNMEGGHGHEMKAATRNGKAKETDPLLESSVRIQPC